MASDQGREVAQQLKNGKLPAGTNLRGIDLSGEDLSEARLRGLDLSGADLREVNLTGVELHSVKMLGVKALASIWKDASLFEVDLSEADLSRAQFEAVKFEKVLLKKSVLRGARFMDATMNKVNGTSIDLTDAHLEGCKLKEVGLRSSVLDEVTLDDVALAVTDLTGSRLVNVDFRNFRLAGARLDNVNMHHAKVSGGLWKNCQAKDLIADEFRFDDSAMEDCKFEHADFANGRFNGGRIVSSSMAGANLKGARFDNTVVTGTSFARAKMAQTTMAGLDLSWIDLSNSDMEEADMTGVSFFSADLSGAWCGRARMDEADFTQANLRSANFQQASVVRAKFDDAEMTGTQMEGANTSETIIVAGPDGTAIRRSNITSATTRTRTRPAVSTMGPASTDGRVDYDMLDVGRPVIPKIAPHPAQQKAGMSPKTKLIVLASTVLVVVVAVLVVYNVFIKEEVFHYEGDEFIGYLEGEDGGKTKTRVDMQMASDEKRVIVSLQLTKLASKKDPAPFDALWAQAPTIRAAGSSHTERMIKLVVGDPAQNGKPIDGLTLNCEIGVSYDLEDEQIKGVVKDGDRQVGEFKFKRPRKGPLKVRQ
ncbi:MAG: pentapeptide repeat-containing protein [Deltaproteobacteria bacterium]|nr:pentapeptide repeat-containing protein [Deltaproteobacteria bacterium]MCB9487259.1 pentapeptide repeat-containing protein [Deltaproteobacteria bacterium]